MSKSINELARYASLFLLGVRIGKKQFSEYFHLLRKEIEHYKGYRKGSYNPDRAIEELRSEFRGVHMNNSFKDTLARQAECYGLSCFDYWEHYQLAESHLLFIIQNEPHNDLNPLEQLLREAEKVDKKVAKEELMPEAGVLRINDYIRRYYLDNPQPTRKTA